MTSIFLSHNHADREFARRLARDLRLARIKVWIDEAEIKIGDSLLSKIQSGIREMEYLGVVLSPNSVNSNWVTRELQAAMQLELSSNKIKVLPILYQYCEIPVFLLDKKYANFTNPQMYKPSLEMLLNTLLDFPEPVYITAREAARLVNTTQHPDGQLWGISQQGILQQYIMQQVMHQGDFYYADAKSGKSKIWILEYYNKSNRTIYPYGVCDGEITDLPSGTLINDTKAIDFNFIDSDIAVSSALAFASAHSAIPDDDTTFYIDTSLRYYEPLDDHVWVITFLDVALSDFTYGIEVNAHDGTIIEAHKPSEFY